MTKASHCSESAGHGRLARYHARNANCVLVFSTRSRGLLGDAPFAKPCFASRSGASAEMRRQATAWQRGEAGAWQRGDGDFRGPSALPSTATLGRMLPGAARWRKEGDRERREKKISRLQEMRQTTAKTPIGLPALWKTHLAKHSILRSGMFVDCLRRYYGRPICRLPVFETGS